MQPVMPEIAAGKGKSTAGPITDRGGLVLPRFLRRPFRISMRFIQEGRWMSPRIVTVFTLLVVGGGTAAGVIHGGQADAMIARATAFLGFRVADIEIKGIKEISRIDILTNIDLGVERSLFSFDVHAMIHAEDAPALERHLQDFFTDRRLNKVNLRKEFFRIPISAIKEKVEELGHQVHWTLKAEAAEWRESQEVQRRQVHEESRVSIAAPLSAAL